MLVKRYQSDNIQQALDQIIRELGPEAVILSNKKIRKKGLKNLFSHRVHEIMVAYDPALLPGLKSAVVVNTPSIPMIDESVLDEVTEANKEHLTRLDQRIDALDGIINDFIQKFTFVKRDITFDYSKDVEQLFCDLLEQQVREELAHIIARETDAIIRSRPDTSAYDAMEQVVTDQLGCVSPISPKKFKQKIVLVVGPTGVGKTTSIVKLAADFAINQKKKVGIINTDTYRIAAQEQLRTYMDILNLPLSIVYSMDELNDEIEAMSDREVIFIDTAGKRPGDEKHIEDVSGIIDICNPEDILLCIPASVSFAALMEIVNSYSFIENYKLMVTKLDETKYRGMILNLCWYTKKDLSYFTTGQNVPDDLEKINIENLVKEILGQKR